MRAAEVSRPVRPSHHRFLISSHLISNLECTWHTISYIASPLALIFIHFAQSSSIKKLAEYKHRMFHVILPFLLLQFSLIPPLPPPGGKKISRLHLFMLLSLPF